MLKPPHAFILLTAFLFIQRGTAQEYISLDELRHYDRYWVVSSFYRDSAEAAARYHQLKEDKWPVQILKVEEKGYEPIYYIIYEKARNRLRALVYQIYVHDFYKRLARIVRTDQLIIQTQKEYQRLKRKRPMKAPAAEPANDTTRFSELVPTSHEMADADTLKGTSDAHEKPSDPEPEPVSHAKTPVGKGNDALSEDRKSLDAAVSPASGAVSSSSSESPIDDVEAEIRRRHQEEAQLPPPAENIQPSYPAAPYYIIIGSFRNLANAQRLASVFQQGQIPVAILKAPKIGYYRVAIYPTFSEVKAREKLRQVREEIIETAWILIRK